MFLVELLQIKHAFQEESDGLVLVPKTSVLEAETTAPMPVLKHQHLSMPALQMNESSVSVDTKSVSTPSSKGMLSVNSYSNSLGKDKCVMLDFNAIFAQLEDDDKEEAYSCLFHADGSVLLKVRLPPGLPASTVLDDQSKSKPKDLALEMEYLYSKFIASSSAHTLNISHSLRAPLTRSFETDCMHRAVRKQSFLFNIFDEVAHSVLDLMLDSFRRFEMTQE